MENQYEIDTFGFDEEPSREQPVLEQHAAETVQEQPENISNEGKGSPFADSPYVQQVPTQSGGYPMPPRKEKKGWGKRLLAAVLVIALVAAGCGVTAAVVGEEQDRQIAALLDQIDQLRQEIKKNSFTGNGNSVSGSVNTSQNGLTPGQVYAQNAGSVVAVTSKITAGQSQAVSSGSGFILSENGYVVSNYHVVEGAAGITVTLNDESEYAAKLVGYDASNDVAVLKIEAAGLQAAKVGSSDDLIVGDQVAAIGHPLGAETPTLTVGYVSAKDQSVSTDGSIINMLQTDAAINSGNSGGPLFNMKGEVVGITTAKYSGTTNSGASIESIGFAIPIDDVVQKVQDLIEFGYVTGAYLGVSVQDMDESVLDAFGFPEGAYVASVVEGGCAHKAGVRAKDMIVAVGQYKVDGVNGLTRALGKFKPGDKTTVTVWRAGAQLTLDITLDAKPIPENAGNGETVAPTQPEDEDTGFQWDFPFGWGWGD